MSLFEIATLLGLLLILTAVVASVSQVRAIAREIRGEARETQARLEAHVGRLGF